MKTIKYQLIQEILFNTNMMYRSGAEREGVPSVTINLINTVGVKEATFGVNYACRGALDLKDIKAFNKILQSAISFVESMNEEKFVLEYAEEN